MPTARPERRLPWIGLVVTVLVSASVATADDVFVGNEADFVRYAGEQPPPSDAPWQRVALPHAWRDVDPGTRSDAWYRFSLPRLDRGTDRLAVQIPKVILNAAVYVNGRWVGQCGRMSDRLARCWNVPLYYEFSPALLEERENVLHVRVAGFAPYARLGPVRVGPPAALSPDHEARTFVQVELTRALSIAGLTLTLVMGALWIGTRDPVYGLFALASLVGAFHGSNGHVREVPLPHWVHEWLLHASLDWFAVLNAIFLHRLLDHRAAQLERALLSFGVVSTVVTAASIPSHFHHATVVLHNVSVAISLYLAWTILRSIHRVSTIERIPWLFLVVAGSAMAIHDALAQAHWIDFHRPRYLTFLLSVFIVTVGSLLAIRFLRHFARAKDRNVELDRAVREKHAELEANFERVRDLERDRLLSQERERIMRELHDGLGGQLVSTIAMVESGRHSTDDVADEIRQSLDDMHLVIDSLDPVVDELPTLLGMIRGRIEPRLKRQGLRFEWRVTDVPQAEWLGPHELLQVLRIVQEALTNVVKHAGAEVVSVSTGIGRENGADGVFIEIVDDGRGIDAAPSTGRGLGNMRSRAASLGARLSVDSPSGGTRVRLWLPATRP